MSARCRLAGALSTPVVVADVIASGLAGRPGTKPEHVFDLEAPGMPRVILSRDVFPDGEELVHASVSYDAASSVTKIDILRLSDMACELVRDMIGAMSCDEDRQKRCVTAAGVFHMFFDPDPLAFWWAGQTPGVPT